MAVVSVLHFFRLPSSPVQNDHGKCKRLARAIKFGRDIEGWLAWTEGYPRRAESMGPLQECGKIAKMATVRQGTEASGSKLQTYRDDDSRRTSSVSGR